MPRDGRFRSAAEPVLTGATASAHRAGLYVGRKLNLWPPGLDWDQAAIIHR